MAAICVIGNSHVGALKLALPKVQPHFPNMTLGFYASTGQSLSLEVRGGKLVAPDERIRRRLATTSGTDGDVEAGRDAYAVCGLGLSAMKAIHAYTDTFTKLRAAGRIKATDVEAFAQTMDDTVRASLALKIVSQLRQITQAPIFVIATPLAAYERHAELWGKLKRAQQQARIAQAYTMACGKVAQDFSATFVPQPPETVGENGLTTLPQFYLLPSDQVKMEPAQHTHMNPAFGAIVLRDLLERIQARLAQAQSV